MAEDHITAPPPSSKKAAAPGRLSFARSRVVARTNEAVNVDIQEEMTVRLARDGLIEEVSLKGGLSVRVNNPEAACCRVHLDQFNAKQFQTQLHPTMNRSFLNDAVVMMKDAKRGFPADSAMTLVRWRLVNGGEDYLPLNVTCWPEQMDGGFDVNVEYALNPAVLPAIRNVRICIPLPGGASPEIMAVDGSYHYVGA